MKDIHTYKNFYFLGIGGIGMSALARYFNFSGAKVWGYDQTQTQLTIKLEEENISIIYEDNLALLPKNINKEETLIIYTPAIPNHLKIKNYFIEAGYTILKRSKVLGEITRFTQCLAIAGTHGKTTTSTLLGYLCKYANLKATAFLGGISANYKTNFIFNGSQISVVEADEYDRSFLALSPNMAAITSTDADHLDIYNDSSNLVDTFNEFAKLIPEEGFLLVKKGLPINVKHFTYSANEKADYYAENIQIENHTFIFDLVTPDQKIEGLILPIPGKHNIENAIAALGIGLKMGISPNVLRKALAEFKGVARRFTHHTFKNGKIYIDDYAHHPSELNATIETIRSLYPGKNLLTVFQPHLFTRTKDFANDFAKSLEQTDQLLLLDIYPARELPIDGVSSEWLNEKIQLNKKQVSSLDQALDIIKEKDFDILLTVGAGNIDILYQPLLKWLNEAEI